MTRQHAPATQIEAGDPWYVDSQFRAQMRTAGRRRVIADRWRVYASMIAAWVGQQRPGATARLRVLDAGCGDGINLAGLHDLARQHRWLLEPVGVDYNPLRLGRARAQGTPVQQASLYALPYRTGAFDVVLCSHVLEHVPDLATALSELHRVLRRGGLLIVAVPNEGCAMARLRNQFLQRHISRTTDHVHFFTAARLTAALAAGGFHPLRLERETFFFPLTYLNIACAEFAAGHALMAVLRRWFPSQAGGLMVSATTG